jgi:hypothetical protein
MQVIKKDITVPIDVDKTLVFWTPEGQKRHVLSRKVDYYGEDVYVIPHKEHCQLVRAMLARGRNVIVWSGNGHSWAENVINMLHAIGELPNIDDIIVMSKPVGYVDDMPCDTWMGNRIYIQPHSNPYAEEKK